MRRLFPQNTFVEPQMPIPSKDVARLAILEHPLTEGENKWFDSLLRHARIDRGGLTIAGCTQCVIPESVKRDEVNEATVQCVRNHVRPLLDSRRWRRLDLFGDKPLRYVAGQNNSVFNRRGSPLTVGNNAHGDLVGLATLPPDYVMKDQTMFPVVVNDLRKSLEVPPEYYTPFPSIEDVRNFRFKQFAFDIECPRYRTLGENAPVEMVGLCARDGFAMCVPVTGSYTAELKRIFRDAEEVIGSNCLQFDLPKLRKADIEVRNECKVHDLMLQQHLLFPDFPHDLEFIGSQFVSKPAWKDDKSCLQIYNCRDTDVTWQCWRQVYPMLKKEGLDSLYWNVQVPLARICLLLHETGFKVDPNRIKNVRDKLLLERAEEERWLPDFLKTHTVPVNRRQEAPAGTLGKSGKPVKYILVPSTESVVPWRSPAQKAAYLYGKGEGCLGQEPVLDAESGNVTTGKTALDKIYSRTKVRAVRAIKKLNQLDELITTFAKEEMVKIDRMFPHFNVHGTSSGRFSSSDPNLQNIPETARFLYVPSHSGWKIVDVDYSQIENRLTAYFAGDSARLQRFRQDVKFSEHRYAASLFLNIPYEDVEKDNDKDAPYGKAKRIVHGTNYGMGYRKIANMYDMDPKETARLQGIWKGAIKPTITWQNRCADKAKKEGFLTTPFGRKRWFWTSSAYTESLSFLPQSTAADVIFRAMIGLMYERIGWPVERTNKIVRVSKPLPWPARLLLQVHDSLIFECPAELVDELVATVAAVMCQPWPELGGMSIPIGVKVGDSWGECEEYISPNTLAVATHT